MSYTFTITEATGADKYDAREIGNAAFKDSAYRHACYPPHLAHLTSAEDLKEWRISQIQGAIETKNSKSFKAVAHDELSGVDRMVGYAIWLTPDFNQTAKSTGDDGSEPTDKKTDIDEIASLMNMNADQLPACIDAGVYKRQVTAADEMRQQIWGENPQKYWYLLGLAVHPDFHRKGVAGMLVKWGLDMADGDGLPVYLEATPAGLPFYERIGFEKLAERSLLDDGSYTATAMERKPNV